MNLFKPLLYQLYLLQLENYSIRGFWRLMRRKVVYDFFGNRSRHVLVWTMKAKLVFVLTLVLAACSSWSQSQNFVGMSQGAQGLIAFGYFVLYANLLGSIFLTLSVWILSPADFLVKAYIVAKGKAKLKQFPNLKIIGITGSFGKTTMKEALATVLAQRYKVLKTPENINTPVGISRLVLKELKPETEIFIVEMGANHKHDIRELTKLAQPDVSVLTGINEAHLETFGNIETTISTKFEIVTFSKPESLVVLNADSSLVKANFEKYVTNHRVIWYQSQEGVPFQANVSLIGGYIIGVLNACLSIGKEFKLSDEEIKRGIEQIQAVPHRLQVIKSPNGITVIDDSYNGNPAGVSEAIKALKAYPAKRRIYITPGLVEMGSENESVHIKIGEQLASVADLIILIRNSATPFIAKGLSSKGFDVKNIVWFNSASKAHASLGGILVSGDVILFQNDWPDNYM